MVQNNQKSVVIESTGVITPQCSHLRRDIGPWLLYPLYEVHLESNVRRRFGSVVRSPSKVAGIYSFHIAI